MAGYQKIALVIYPKLIAWSFTRYLTVPFNFEKWEMRRNAIQSCRGGFIWVENGV